MAQWCFLLARTTTRGEKKQQGLTIFLVPMDDPAIQVRPIRAMLGPHHLNEVFFDDLRVTEADVLGEVDRGWSIVQDVMSFERVGIARYARCERLLAAAPAVLGDRWEDLPAELRGRWVRMLTHCRRARLLAYRVVSLQSSGRIQPGDAAAYRIAVTKLDQDSAEVLMEIAAEVSPRRSRWPMVPRRGGGPLAVLAGVHRLVRQHRDAAHPAVPCPAGGAEMSGTMILDLSEDAKEYGRQALRAFEAAGGDQLVQQAEAKPDTREALVGPVLNELGAWELDARTDADGLEAAAALCRSAGYWALPYPVAERLARPTDLDADGLIVVASNRPAGAVGGVETRWTAVTLDGSAQCRRRPRRRRPGVRHAARALGDRPTAGPATWRSDLVLPCWTLLGMLDRALELTIAHVSLRKQFGQPLSSFQGVQFQLTDAEVERSGRGHPRQVRAVEHRGTTVRKPSTTHSRCGCRPSKRPRWSSGCAISCTAPSGSATRPRCPGCPATASRCAGCRSGLSATRDELTRRAGSAGLTGLYA